MKEKTLPNGVRVMAVRKSSCSTVTIGIFLGAGGIDAHLLEHLSILRGTVNWPNAIELYAETGKISDNCNGDTGHATTLFFIEGYRKHFTKMLDLVSDFFLNPLLSEDGIEREKGPVISEIGVGDDNSMEKSQQLLGRLMYGNQPAGKLITGTAKDVLALSRKKLLKYRRDHYLPESTVVVVAGPIQEADVFAAVEEKFSSFKKEKSKRPKKTRTRQRQSMPKMLLFERDTNQTYFSFGFRTYPISSTYVEVLDVLKELLGTVNHSARLFKRLRFEMGATYDVDVDNYLFADRGKLRISLAANSDQSCDVVSAVIDELKKLKRKPVSKSEKKKAKLELEEAKRLAIMDLKNIYDNSEELVKFYGEQAAIGGSKRKVLSIKEKQELIKKVQVKDIYMIARKIFTNKKMNLAIVGPHKSKQPFARVFKFK